MLVSAHLRLGFATFPVTWAAKLAVGKVLAQAVLAPPAGWRFTAAQVEAGRVTLELETIDGCCGTRCGLEGDL